MRSVAVSVCILVARMVLIVFFDSLADPAMGVAVVAALLVGIIWLPNERHSQWPPPWSFEGGHGKGNFRDRVEPMR